MRASDDGRRYGTGRFRRRAGVPAGMALLLLALGLGCETTLDPIVDDGRHFSIFGFLDAGSDTQFVRVRPLRPPFGAVPDVLDASVRLEALDRAEVYAMRDSVVRFADGAAHVFWLARPVPHGQTYRLTVTRSDGLAATATVTTPEAIPTPRLFLQRMLFTPPEDFLFSVHAAGAKRIVALDVIYTVQSPDAPVGTSQVIVSMLDFVARHGDELVAQINPYRTFYRDGRERNCPIVQAADVRLAIADADWPEAGIDLETWSRVDVVSNIEGGVGYLGAVSSFRLPAPDLVQHLTGLRGLCLACAGSLPGAQCRR